MSKIITVAFFIITIVAFANTQSSSTIFDKVKSGIKFAETFLSMDKSSGVAKLVSETFGNLTNFKHKNNSLGTGLITGFFKILGFNANKIGAIAINGLIFLAQMLGSSLSIKPPSRLLKAREIKELHLENPLSWMLNNIKVSEMISHATDKGLPDEIIEYIKERSLDEETGCIQLLICKIAPFIWGMQKTLGEMKKGNSSASSSKWNGRNVFLQYLPTTDEMWKRSDECEEKHHYCVYDDL